MSGAPRAQTVIESGGSGRIARDLKIALHEGRRLIEIASQDALEERRRDCQYAIGCGAGGLGGRPKGNLRCRAATVDHQCAVGSQIDHDESTQRHVRSRQNRCQPVCQSRQIRLCHCRRRSRLHRDGEHNIMTVPQGQPIAPGGRPDRMGHKMTWDEEIADLYRRRDAAQGQGGPEAVAAHHARGRLTIRERIARLTDPGSFAEHGLAAGHQEPGEAAAFSPANYVVGVGHLNGRPAVVGGEDFTLRGGSPNAAGLRKSVYAEDLALHLRLPLVRLLEGGGGSVRGSGGGNRPAGEPVFSRPRFQSFAHVYAQSPVASAALGPVAGFPAARLAASHFSVMTRETAAVMVAGPAIVERALGVRPTKEELGGAKVHGASGAVDNIAADEDDALDQIRRFLGFLPANVWDTPPTDDNGDPADRCDDRLAAIVPRDRRKAYDIRKIASLIFDNGSVFELGKTYGKGIVTLLARLQGRPVGILANDCRFYAGAMTALGAQKARRLIDLCNQFGLPVVSLVDEPGFMIGPDAEEAATIRHGTVAVMAAATSRVPWASVIIRKAFGVAAAAHFGPNAYVLAWPSAEMGALPIEGGVAVAFGRDIAAAEDPEARRAELEAQFAAGLSPFPRAESFSLHEVIDPRETRPFLCRWLDWQAGAPGPAMGPWSPGPRP